MKSAKQIDIETYIRNFTNYPSQTTLQNSFYNIGFDIPVFRMLLQHNDSPYLEVSRLGRYLILGCITICTIAVRRAQLHNQELHSCTTDWGVS